MNKMTAEESIDISTYNITRGDDYALEIPELKYVEKETSIRVSIGNQVFALIALGEGKFIPWYFPKN